MKYTRFLMALAIVGALSVSAQADLTYRLGDGSDVDAFDGPGLGLEIETDVLGISGLTFDLANGESQQFGFFNIWTDEGTVNWDDLLPRSITATLDFDLPNVAVNVGGDTVGVVLYGLLQAGEVTWDGPATVVLSDRTFRVELSEEMFNQGFFGLDSRWGATVTATVTQLSSSNSNGVVPAPGAAVLALIGMSLVGWIKRRIA